MGNLTRQRPRTAADIGRHDISLEITDSGLPPEREGVILPVSPERAATLPLSAHQSMGSDSIDRIKLITNQKQPPVPN